jgi:LysM repeat protein
MNPNESPLVPQGSFLEQKNKGRARVKIAVFVVLAIHGVGLMALLMQGCKPSSKPTEFSSTDTNSLEELTNADLPVMEATNAQVSVPPTTVSTLPDPGAIAATSTVPEPVLPVASATEHKILKGENFAKLAQQYHVTINAIKEANPGVDPTKLQIGQTIKIPAPTAVGAASTGAVSPPAGTGDSQSYTVKSGDTLIRIANQFGVTVKAIRSANNLTTDRIRVGQHLKIPVKVGAQNPPTTPEPIPGTSTTGSQ